MKNNKINIKIILELNKCFFGKSTDEDIYYFFKKIENIIDDKKESDLTKYHNLVKINNDEYEALEFKKIINQNILEQLFHLVSNVDKTLYEIMSELNKLLKGISFNLNIEEIRGVFAEISAFLNYSLIPYPHHNSIYDFKNENNNDVEIKSFSKVKREFKVSYQQLTNNKNAELILIEVFETSTGMSLLDIYNKLSDSIMKERFSWINEINSPVLNIKFKTGEIFKKNIQEISKGLSMPENSFDATFIFKIDGFIK